MGRSLSKRRLLGENLSIQVPGKNYGTTESQPTFQSNRGSQPKISTNRITEMDPKQKAQKFQELMKAGSESFQQLEGLNTRFQLGVGQGKSYYDA